MSAFGFGGTNFHAVLSGYDGADEPLHGLRDWPAELIVLRGDAAAAAGKLRELAAANDAAGRPWRLAELAATMAARTGPVRAAFVADDLDDLAAQLDGLAARPGGLPPGQEPGSAAAIAFLFPGQGSQRPGMAGDLFAAFPRLQRLLRLGDPRYAEAMFPPAAFTKEDRDRRAAAITDTRVAQPALGIADLALHELLTMVGISPDMAAGHSYGEFVALCAAGAYDAAGLLALSETRAAAILEAAGDDPGAMAAVTAPASEISASLDGTGVVVANYNAPGQTVISGATPAVDAVVEALTAQGAPARRIPVACAFHSPLVAAAAGTMATALDGRDISAPRFPVFANSTAAPYPDQPGEVRRILANHVAEPVRFTEQIETMYAAGARTFIEAGPGRVLTGLVGRILGDRPHTAVACDVPGENGLRRFVTVLAELISAGVPVDPWPLFAKRAEPVSGTPVRPQWVVDGHMARTADGRPLPGGLQPATSVPRFSLGDQAPPADGPAASADRDRVITEFLRGSRELVAAQRDVVLGYLGVAGGPAGPLALAPSAIAAAEQTTEPQTTEPQTAEPQPGGPASRAEIGEVVAAVISARTGYPPEMLGADLDLEADLSVDSIKRTEIIAALAERLGLSGAGAQAAVGESVMEQLTRIKTISGITDWLAGHTGVQEPAQPAGLANPAAAEEAAPRAQVGTPRRHLVHAVGIAAPAVSAEPGDRRFLIIDDDRGIALELSELLEQRGAQAVTTRTPTREELAGADAIVHLGALRPGAGAVLPGGFEQVRDALAEGIRTLLVVTAGGPFGYGAENDDASGLGLRGMVRAIAAEYPDALARAVDVEPKESPRVIAAQLLAELTDRAGPSVVGYRGRQRMSLQVRRAPELAAPAAGTGLTQESVVLLTGGARGITASVALALARSAGCHIELIGRTPLSGAVDPATAAVTDPHALRRMLADSGIQSAREVEAAVTRIIREREVRVTLDGLRDAAASVRYHAVDVRDAAAVGAVIDDVYARYGRLDGVIHGAGVVEDRLVPDKAPDSFARVYATKVDGARALVAGLRRPDAMRSPSGLPRGEEAPGDNRDVRFLVLFGSVSGVFGNRGQVDYAAANDALDTLARQWSTRADRVVAIDWGPWAGPGMITPELEREYARRGVTLIDPDAGASCLLAEIAAGSGPAQVIYMCDEVSGG